MMRARQLDRLDAVGRLERCIAMGLQQVVEELHVELVVLDDQNRLLHLPPSPHGPGFSGPSAAFDARCSMRAVDETQTRNQTRRSQIDGHAPPDHQ